ncbi:MAG: NrtA/SsuA/CpmA family ABC transporter substrate-binding protein [Armatimonadota bacterium]|nr:NrtA/SsuA/CpmA family ABC transporter substrate-binding protein [Armatimonadota bacterium]
MRKGAWATFVMVLLAAVTAGPAGAQAPIPVRIAWQPYNAVIFYTARDLKLFERVGLQPEYTRFTAGPPQFAAFRSESVDVGLFGTAGMVVGASQDLDYRNFYIQIWSAYADGLVARPESGITRIQDLRGKKIAFVRGTSAHLGLIKTLQRAGLSPSDVTMIHMDVTAMAPAFANRDVDAAYSWEPWISRMQEAGGRVIVRSIQVGLQTSDHWVARTAWVQKNPRAVLLLLRAVDLALEEFKRNPAIAIKATAENLGVSESIARRIVEINPVLTLEQLVDPKFELSLLPGGGAQRMIQEVGDFLLQQGIIRAPIDASKIVEASYIQSYLRTRTR